MAIDTIARGLALALLGADGKISSDKLPTFHIEDTSGFTPVGHLTDASQIEGKTLEEVILMMLFGVVNPTFTNPSFSIELDNAAIPTLIVGKPTTISGRLIFNRGTIEPPYGTSGYRCGSALNYTVNGITQTETNFSILLTPTLGENTISASVQYSEGEQPKNSVGAAFDLPYPAGSLTASIVLNAVFPLYKPDATEQEAEYFEDNDGVGYLSLFISEFGGDKQAFMIPADYEVVGIKQFNILMQEWDWIGGSAEDSLTTFDTTTVIKDEVEFIEYIHNGSARGERELRIYIAQKED